jgi:DNA-binding CsgD family transcriptional regulator
MFTVRREQGRLAEVAPVIRHVAAGARDAWGPALALLLAELGLLEEARRELRRLCSDDFAQVPRGGLRLGGLAYLADACTLVDDRELAARVYSEMAGLEGRNVVIGQAVACYGAADRFLGMLATTMGDLTAAERHFEAALEHNARLASPTWLAHTGVAYADALRRRGGGEDLAHASELLARAAETARRTGMVALAARAQRAGAPAAVAVVLPDGLSPRETEVLRLVSAGRSNREIGDALRISQHTAANHVRSILFKTGCANRTEAASYAHRHRLMER